MVIGQDHGQVPARQPEQRIIWDSYELTIDEIIRLSHIDEPSGSSRDIELHGDGIRITIKYVR